MTDCDTHVEQCVFWVESARTHTDTAAMAALRTISPRQCLDLLTVQGGISKILEMIMRQQEM